MNKPNSPALRDTHAKGPPETEADRHDHEMLELARRRIRTGELETIPLSQAKRELGD